MASSPVSSCLTRPPGHVELAQTQTATELLRVFGTFWGDFCSEVDNIKMPFRAPRLNLLVPLSCLVFCRYVWFSRQRPDSLQQRGRLQTESISCSSSKLPSVCRGSKKEDPSENQSGLRQHCCCCCCCMVKHRGAPTVRYSLYIFTQGQIKIMWASPEGERECAVWSPEQGAATTHHLLIVTAAHFCPIQIRNHGPNQGFHWHHLLSCAICRSDVVFFLSSASGSQDVSSRRERRPSLVFLHQTRPWSFSSSGGAHWCEWNRCVCHRCPPVFPFVCRLSRGERGGIHGLPSPHHSLPL